MYAERSTVPCKLARDLDKDGTVMTYSPEIDLRGSYDTPFLR